MAKEGRTRRWEQIQLHHWGRRPSLRCVAHGWCVVTTRRLLFEQAAYHSSQGGGRWHVHLPWSQYHGLQLPQCLPYCSSWSVFFSVMYFNSILMFPWSSLIIGYLVKVSCSKTIIISHAVAIAKTMNKHALWIMVLE